MKPEALFGTDAYPLLEQVVKLLADGREIESLIPAELDADFFTEYTLISAIVPAVCAQRQDASLPVNGKPGEHLIGRRLSPEEIDKYPSLRIAPLVGQESYHFSITEKLDHIFHNALVRKRFDGSFFSASTEKVAGEKWILEWSHDEVQSDSKEFYSGRADLEAAEVRV